MMTIALNNIRIIDKFSPYNEQVKSLLIEDGVIKVIGDAPLQAELKVEGDDLSVSVGWFDLGTYVGDPGYEHKEDIESICEVAAAGGFTEIAVLPNTLPPIQQKNGVKYLTAGNPNRLVQIYPIASVTFNNEGTEITEMIDLHHAGAVAFSDGLKPIWNTDILLKGLQYLKKINGLLMQRPEDKWLNLYGQMHEGQMSTSLGLKGIPALSEYLTIERDLKLLQYTSGKIHFSNISTSESVALIRQAKQQGLQVSCDVAVHNLHFDDQLVLDFDANYKVNPPLRSREHIDSLWTGLKDNTIDAIVSAHRPHDEECKKLEFDLADFGMLGLQTLFPLMLQHAGDFSIPQMIEKISSGPRQLLGLPNPSIKEGEKANLTIMNEKEDWVYANNTNYSKSTNSPLFKEKLKGRIKGVINNQKIKLFD
ncbi:MAG: dihydroorotase [Cyclobacteriaceae bacterium]